MRNGIAPALYRRALVPLLALALLTPSLHPAPAFAATTTTFTFNGGGWGHGIGLSQYGAKTYAEKGWTYDRILKHYYQGTRLETRPDETVKVNLDKGKASRSSWRIQAGTDTTLTVTQNSDSRVVVSLRQRVNGAPAIYWLTTSDGKVRLHRDDGGRAGTIIKTFAGRVHVSSSTPVRIVDRSGPFDHTGVRWRGRLHFIPDSSTASRSTCINYVGLEDYLKGVVPRESPSSWPAEALKAQAVAARSYAYQDAVDGRVLWCTTMSQVYNGHSRPGHAHEPASTTSAIDATKGRLVWYGTETRPVKTYFSSSSGGHTANIEDVWFSSAKPYYKGVADDDTSGNPYRTWTVGPLSASDVAAKIRARVGSSSSAPSPHTVTRIALERAATGHARYATVTWSNGASHRIKGDTLRSALGLKSTRFTVVTTAPEPVKNLYAETNGSLAWSGVWERVSSVGAFGSTYRRTTTVRSSLVAEFTGTGVEWYGTTGPGLGKADIHLDGAKVATVDLYSSKTTHRRRLFVKAGLKNGTHRLTITAIRSKNARSTGYGATVDRINVYEGVLRKASQPVERYEESRAHVAELGGWSRETTSVASGGTHAVNARRGSRIVVDFIGTRIDWVAATGPRMGAARVSVNGSTPVTVSLARDTGASRSVFSRSGLASGSKHRLVIEVVGAGSSDTGIVSADRFDVTGGWVVPPTLAAVRISEGTLPRTGTWKPYRNTLAAGGSHLVSGRRGSSVTIPFEGTSVAWYGARTRWYGRAEVLLDGTRVAIVDTYSPTTKLNQRIWSRSGLSAKRHTLTIRVLGTKRAAALGTLVSVDAFRVSGQLAR